jgi:hypothetical protein
LVAYAVFQKSYIKPFSLKNMGARLTSNQFTKNSQKN